ncbi:hypothetical protein LEP1GSC050_0607 [Leptospira broomii serovar Hurstbridge str. 5399]|uniref:SH3b domain-containing protein n=1 Tax=Leptospira broomii serovar Hurstbridge str. 5399 TaxID=1049789 RepID=T0FI71_9LEPT|nr:SH3 domain-containing protein [Leptospira broomii]EQA47302.1 hypothetical protein LEP1GSC050_0607 [Leptospira broomii serovar Hurstbridge str. 5399]
MKRGFFLSLFGIAILVLFVVLAWKFWPKPSDTIYENFKKGKWEKVVKSVRLLTDPSPYDLFYASQSLVSFNAELKKLESSEQTQEASRFSSAYKIPYIGSGDGVVFPVFEDVFLSQLSPGSFLRQKAVAYRLETASDWEEETAFLKLLKEFSKSNPIPLGPKYSLVLRKALKRETILSESDKKNLEERLGFLSTREESSFFGGRLKNTGENTNLRTGPGTENPGRTRLKKGVPIFVLDKDPRSETIGGKKGNWLQVFVPELPAVGWIFSSFTEEDPFPSEKAESMLIGFSESEKSQAWDFAFWEPEQSPPGFHGDYIKTEKIALDGDYGIVLYRSQNGKYKEICRLVEEPFRSLEFLTASLSGEDSVPLFRLYSGQPGSWNLAFQIDLDSESVSINRNKYITGNASSKRRFQLAISPTESGSNALASLLVGENIVLQGIRPEEEFSPGEETRYKLCLLQPEKRSGSNLAAFRFKFQL